MEAVLAVADCVHLDFAAFVSVQRLFDDEDEATAADRLPDRFSADVLIECAGCGERFVFVGSMDVGVSPREPMVSADRRELRAPIRPASAPPGWGEGGASVTLRVDEPRQN